MDAWDAEIEVTPDLARTLLGPRFTDVRPLATGWDNTVFLADDTWIVRFPRREVAVPGVEREIAVLPGLAGRLPLPVPRPELVGAPSARFPWPFWGGPLIEGVELACHDGPRERIAADVGAFLRVLHALDPGDLPADPLRRGDPVFRAEQARARLAELAAKGHPTPDCAALFEAGARVGTDASRLVLTHGDLHVRHVLVADDRAVGVIDWGDVCRADPAVDLSLVYGAFDAAARDAFFDAYGAISPATAIRARVLAVFITAALAAYADATARPVLRDESLAGLFRAASAE
ncbi:phosphotransferase [Actinomadura flavalba]|uniref:phosphotransferase n=1 Tax=Actinomadura flavalba TaxID=1120938 RepID=UPI00036D4A4D|nr:phosphotransferase [Actinomadura flavalba]